MNLTWTLRERDTLREKVSTLATERNAAILEINRLRALMKKIVSEYDNAARREPFDVIPAAYFVGMITAELKAKP